MKKLLVMLLALLLTVGMAPAVGNAALKHNDHGVCDESCAYQDPVDCACIITPCSLGAACEDHGTGTTVCDEKKCLGIGSGCVADPGTPCDKNGCGALTCEDAGCKCPDCSANPCKCVTPMTMVFGARSAPVPVGTITLATDRVVYSGAPYTPGHEATGKTFPAGSTYSVLQYVVVDGVEWARILYDGGNAAGWIQVLN